MRWQRCGRVVLQERSDDVLLDREPHPLGTRDAIAWFQNATAAMTIAPSVPMMPTTAP